MRFGEWLPDLPALGNNGVTIAKNVLPAPDGYLPAKKFVPLSLGFGTNCRGVFSAKDPDGTSYVFAGDATKLYKLNNATLAWEDISKAGGYALGATDQWRFCKFGNTILAVAGKDVAPQKFKFYDTPDALFSNLAGSPPPAYDIANVNNIVVLVSPYVGGKVLYESMQWSGIGDATVWTAGTLFAGSAPFQDGGKALRVLDLGYMAVFQEQCIRRAFFNTTTTWDVSKVESSKGAIAPGSVVGYGTGAFYFSTDGVYFFDGAQSVPIGNRKVDQWLINDIDLSALHYVSGGRDPAQKLIYWGYRSNNAGELVGCDRLLVYHYGVNKFSLIETDSAVVVPTTMTIMPLTLEILDLISVDLDSLFGSLDDPAFNGGYQMIVLVDNLGRLVAPIGQSMAATIETGELQIHPVSRTIVRGAYPLVDGATAKVAIGYRSLQEQSVSYTSPTSQARSGLCPQRANGKFIRTQVSVAENANFNKIIGCNLDYQPVGGSR